MVKKYISLMYMKFVLSVRIVLWISIFLFLWEKNLFPQVLQKEDTEELYLKEILKKEKFKKAKVFHCQESETNKFHIAILQNGEAYIIYQRKIKKIPLSEKINPKDLRIACKNQELVLFSRKPLSNITHKQIYSVKGYNIEFIGSSSKDTKSSYFENLFQEALKGNKKKILALQLEEIPFSYQYVNAETISQYLEMAVEKSKQYNDKKKKEILETVGILTTKLIFFYHLNRSQNENLELYSRWMDSWERLGLDHYEYFLLEYAKVNLKINPQKGIEIITQLQRKKPDFIPAYILKGDYYWDQFQQEKAIELYKKALDIYARSQSSFSELEHIPSYVKERVQKFDNKKKNEVEGNL